MLDKEKSKTSDAGVPPVLGPLLRRLPPNATLQDNNLAALKVLAQHVRTFPTGHVFKRFRQRDPDAVVLLEGLAARNRETVNGKRSIVGFLLPGEIAVTKPAPEASANYELVARSPCIAATLPLSKLQRLEKKYPGVRAYIEWNAQREIHALQDQLVATTTGTVEDRLVFLLNDLHRRLAEVERVDGPSMDLPLRQHDFADAVGASAVRVSKVLTKMRREGAVQIRHGRANMRVTLPRNNGA